MGECMRYVGVLWLFAIACGDNSTVTPSTFVLEDLPADRGFSIRTPEFEVPQGQEIQDCYFFRVPDLDSGADLLVDRVALGLNTGSHHMSVFRVKTIVDLDPAKGEPVDLGAVQGTVVRGAPGDGPCWKSANWSDWPLVANSQQSAPDQKELDWDLPENVALHLAPGEMLMLQVHYVNASDQPTPFEGRGGVNFYRSMDGDSIELGTLFASQQSIRICQSNPQPTFSGACALPAGSHTVAAANGHFHSRGRRFRIWAWDGVSTTTPDDSAKFYDSTDWAEPDMLTDLSVALPQTGGIWWTCDFQWTPPEAGCDALNARDPQHANDCCYTFGPKVETSEHCNVFAYYYPKMAGDISCF